MRRVPCSFAPIVGLLVLILGLLVPGATMAQGTPPTSNGHTADLPAMTLLPADLERAGLSGFRHEGAFVESLTGEARNLAGYWGHGFAVDAVASRLRAAGWQRKYVDTLNLSTSDPSHPQRVVRAYVTEYADAAGAATGFGYVTGGPLLPTEQVVAGTLQIGEQEAITRDRGTSADGRSFRSLDLTFRQGNLVAGVTVINYAGRGFGDPDLAIGEALAAVLASRLAAPATDARLGPRVPRFQGEPPAITTYDDAYYRLDGVEVPLSDESRTSAAARTRSYADARDVYQLWQGAQVGDGASVLVGQTLMRFPSRSSAADWLGGLATELGKNPYYGDLQPLPAPLLGDEAAAFAYTPPGGRTRSALLVATRVGPIVGRVQLVPQGGLRAIPLAAAVELAKTQAACLSVAACPQPPRLPTALTSPATP